jgi:hypothetical protein
VGFALRIRSSQALCSFCDLKTQHWSKLLLKRQSNYCANIHSTDIVSPTHPDTVPCGAGTQHTTLLLPKEFCHQLMVHIKVIRLFLQIRLPSSSKLPSWQAAGRVLCLRHVSCRAQGLGLRPDPRCSQTNELFYPMTTHTVASEHLSAPFTSPRHTIIS